MKPSLLLFFVGIGIGVGSLAQAQSAYDPGKIEDLPKRVQAFVSKMNSSSNRVSLVASQPSLNKAAPFLEQYYRNQMNHFQNAMSVNVSILSSVGKIFKDADEMDNDSKFKKEITECLDKKDSWKDSKKALKNVNSLASQVGRAMPTVSSGYSNRDSESRINLSDDSITNYKTLADYLNVDQSSDNIKTNIAQCCAKRIDNNSQEFCSESHIDSRLAGLDGLVKVPVDFVDPLNPGAVVSSLTTEDMLTMMSLGQMNDFVEAKDYNAQVTALLYADLNCQEAREKAIAGITSRAQKIGLGENVFSALQCSLHSFAQDWGRGARNVVLGLTKSNVKLYSRVSQCPQAVQDQAALELTYLPQQFNQEFANLAKLPYGITYSAPVAKPVEIYSDANGLRLDMRDQAGYVRSSVYLSGQAAPTTSPLGNVTIAQNPTTSSIVRGVASTSSAAIPTSVSNAATASTSTSRAGNVVRGLGEAGAKIQRQTVRALASKTVEGDLESARSLAGSVRSQKQAVQAKVVKQQADRGLSARSAARGTTSRQLATQGVALGVQASVAQSYSKLYKNLGRALGEGGDRVVERPTGPTPSGIPTNPFATTTTSNSASVDLQAQQNYRLQQQQQNLAQTFSSINGLAEGINNAGSQLANIVNQKNQLIDTFGTTFDPARNYSQLSEMGATDRTNKISALSTQWSQIVKEINILSTQEIGLRATIASSQSSLQNAIAMAQAYQGLNVRSTAVAQGGASVPGLGTPGYPTATNYGITNQPQATFQPSIPNTASGAPAGSSATFNPYIANPQLQQVNLMPQFNANLPGGQNASVFIRAMEFLFLPQAQAAAPTLSQLKKKLLGQINSFIESYDKYSEKLASDELNTKKSMWTQFVLSERENRKDNYFSTQVRVVVNSFNDAIREELPDLLAAKNSKSLASGSNPQIYNYIEDIRRESGALNEVLATEAMLALKNRTRNPAEDEESWTGMLPALALQ